MYSNTDSFMSKIVEERKRPLLLLLLNKVDVGELIEVEKALSGKTFDNLDVLLQTPGGSADRAYQIAKILGEKSKHITIIIPLFAKSAGTLISLIGDSFVLTELSELGPLDTQVNETQDDDSPKYKSALEEFKALEQARIHCLETLDQTALLILKKSGMKISSSLSLAIDFVGETSSKLYDKFDSIKIGKYARALAIGKEYGVRLLERYKGKSFEEARNIVDHLVYDYPSHTFVIDKIELKSLGFVVESVSEELVNLLVDNRMLLLKETNSLIKLYSPQDESKNIKTSKTKRKNSIK